MKDPYLSRALGSNATAARRWPVPRLNRLHGLLCGARRFQPHSAVNSRRSPSALTLTAPCLDPGMDPSNRMFLRRW